MQRYLLIDADRKDGAFTGYIFNSWFIAQLQMVTSAIPEPKQLTEGHLERATSEPLPLKVFRDWIDLWKLLHHSKGTDRYEKTTLLFSIGGRTIVKRARYDDLNEGTKTARATDKIFQARIAPAKVDLSKRLAALEYHRICAEDEASGGKKKDKLPDPPKDNPFVKHYQLFSLPALKAEIAILLSKGAPSEHGGDGYYMADTELSGHLPGRMWSRYEGASYPDFASYMDAVLGEAEKKMNAQFLEDLRRLLVKPSSPPQSSVGKEIIPLLASAMFIAEPARQPRTFLNGLILLDLIGQRYGKKKVLTLRRALAGPTLGFDDPKGGKFAPARSGSATNPQVETEETKLAELTTRTQQSEASLLIKWIAMKEPVLTVDGWQSVRIRQCGTKYNPPLGTKDLLTSSDELEVRIKTALQATLRKLLAEKLDQ